MADNNFWKNLPTDETDAPVAEAPAVDAMAQGADAPVQGGKRKKSAKAIVSEKLDLEVNASGNNGKFRKYCNSLEVVGAYGFADRGSSTNSTNDYLAAAVARGIVKVVPATDLDTQCYVEVKNPDVAGSEILGGVIRQKESGNGYYQPYIKGTNKVFTKRTDVPLLVGYRIKNVSNEPIPVYMTTCYRDGQGVWQESNPELIQLAPGAETQITKKMLVFTSALLEYSGTFSNGTIVSSKADGKESLIDKAHFVFDKRFAGRSVHDADFKVRIDQPDENGYSRVLPEYEEHFGVCENLKLGNGKKGRQAVAGKYSSSDILAKLIRDSLTQN